MNKVFDKHFFLAFFVSTGPILILSHGFLNTGPVFTGLLIAVSTISVFLFGRWREFSIVPTDLLFAAFIFCVAVSFFLNGGTASAKEIQLFALSAAAYPACRAFSGGVIKPSFLWVTALIVAIGTLVTSAALIEQWSAGHGRPLVFGEFDAAAIEFLTSLGFLIIASACTGLTLRRSAILSVLLLIPVAIFAASMVRFTFVAIAGSLLVAALIGPPKERKYVALIALSLVVGIACGLSARFATTEKFARAEIESLAPIQQPMASEVPKAEAICPTVDLDNSIAIRRQLFTEALVRTQHSGFFGSGLDSFMNGSCIKGTQVHNSILQAFVEFGWVGGTVFLLLILSAGVFLLPLARNDQEVRFALCSLVYVLTMSMAHGRLSRDALLFLFLGYATGLHDRLTRTALQPDDRRSYHLEPA